MFLFSAPADLEWLRNQSFNREDALKTHQRATDRAQAEEPASSRSSDLCALQLLIQQIQFINCVKLRV